MQTPASTLRAAVAVITLSLLSTHVATAEIQVALSGTPPSGETLFSFEGKTTGEAWGWTGIDDEWRDIGMSFRSSKAGQIDRITMHIQKISYGNFAKKSGFSLRIFETQSLEQPPETGKLVYAGKGEIALTEGDRDKYLTFTLDKKVPIAAGAVYTYLLSWDGKAPYNVIVFHSRGDYGDGRAWFREGGSWAGRRAAGAALGEWEYLDQPDKPGLVFFIQGTAAAK